jgi:hypothetical protein
MHRLHYALPTLSSALEWVGVTLSAHRSWAWPEVATHRVRTLQLILCLCYGAQQKHCIDRFATVVNALVGGLNITSYTNLLRGGYRRYSKISSGVPNFLGMGSYRFPPPNILGIGTRLVYKTVFGGLYILVNVYRRRGSIYRIYHEAVDSTGRGRHINNSREEDILYAPRRLTLTDL